MHTYTHPNSQMIRNKAERYRLSLRGEKAKENPQTTVFSLNCTLKLSANQKPHRHVQACAQNILGKHPLFPCRQRDAHAHTHTSRHTVKWQEIKAAMHDDFLLMTQFNDPYQHDLIFSNTSPELLRVDYDFHNGLCIVWRYASSNMFASLRDGLHMFWLKMINLYVCSHTFHILKAPGSLVGRHTDVHGAVNTIARFVYVLMSLYTPKTVCKK